LDNAYKDLSGTKKLLQNTKKIYSSKLRSCINKAFNDGIIPINPLRGSEGFKIEETEKTYLTFEEVKKMAKTACKKQELKRAFLFACLTGLRKSDIEKKVKINHLYVLR
jgi:integrase